MIYWKELKLWFKKIPKQYVTWTFESSQIMFYSNSSLEYKDFHYILVNTKI